MRRKTAMLDALLASIPPRLLDCPEKNEGRLVSQTAPSPHLPVPVDANVDPQLCLTTFTLMVPVTS